MAECAGRFVPYRGCPSRFESVPACPVGRVGVWGTGARAERFVDVCAAAGVGRGRERRDADGAVGWYPRRQGHCGVQLWTVQVPFGHQSSATRSGARRASFTERDFPALTAWHEQADASLARARAACQHSSQYRPFVIGERRQWMHIGGYLLVSLPSMNADVSDNPCST